MQMIKEITHPDGSVERHIIKPETSVDQIKSFASDMNDGIGYSLCPFSFQGGFSVSTSWVFFFCAIFFLEGWGQGVMGLIWLLSMFIRFR